MRKVIFGPKMRPKAERSEVLGDFGYKKAFTAYILGPNEPLKPCFGGFWDQNVRSKGHFGAQNRPKAERSEVLGDFGLQNGPNLSGSPFQEGVYRGFGHNRTWPPLVFL